MAKKPAHIHHVPIVSILSSPGQNTSGAVNIFSP
jgi:hypothetical protein